MQVKILKDFAYSLEISVPDINLLSTAPQATAIITELTLGLTGPEDARYD